MSISRKQSLLDLLEKEPDDSFLNYALALELHKEGKSNEAIDLIERLLAKDENYLGAYLQLGQLFEEAGKKKNALQIYEKGCSIAKKQNKLKALSELNQAILILED